MHEVLVDQRVVVAQLVVLGVNGAEQAHVVRVVKLGRRVHIEILASAQQQGRQSWRVNLRVMVQPVTEAVKCCASMGLQDGNMSPITCTAWTQASLAAVTSATVIGGGGGAPPA